MQGGRQVYAAVGLRLRHPADCIDDGSGRAGDALPCPHKGLVSGNQPQGHSARPCDATEAASVQHPSGEVQVTGYLRLRYDVGWPSQLRFIKNFIESETWAS